MSTEKDQLARELQDRSHDVGGHPVALESVKRSARRIQRRRRVAGGLVAAMALALAVPAAVSVTGGATRTTPDPLERPTATRTPRPEGPVTLTTDGLRRGADPRVPYFLYDGRIRQLVTPERRVAFPLTMLQVTGSPAGWVGIAYDGRGPELLTFDEELRIVDREPTADTFALSADRSRIAFVRAGGPRGGLLVDAPVGVGATDAARGWDLRRYEAPQPVGFLDEATVVFETAGEQPVVGVAGPDERVRVLPGLLGAADASEVNGLVSGQVSYSVEDGSCYGVVDPATTRSVWETCDRSLGRFSPDGRFVIGGTPDADGMGSPTLAILDAQTGEVVVEFRPPRNRQLAVSQAVWEDSDRVIGLVYDQGRWTMVRFTTSGGLESAGGERPGADMDLPYWFAEVPRG